MINITIKVSGPGQCIDQEFYIVLDALTKAGYDVEVVNPYPNEDPERLLTIPINPKITKIKLVADHQPWGG